MLEMTTPPKVALITGVTAQDGAYLSELLLDKGFKVFAIKPAPARSTLAVSSQALHNQPMMPKQVQRSKHAE